MKFTCMHCGKEDSLDNWSPGGLREVMKARTACFGCAFWLEQAQEERELAIVDEEFNHYRLGAEDADRYFRGHAGRRFTIQMLDGTQRVSTNLWSQGQVPQHLRYLFTPNAKEV